MLTLDQASAKLLSVFPEDVEVASSVQINDDCYFLVSNFDNDGLNLDPFFKVNLKTGIVSDFSPQEFPNPQDILKRLGF